jgi:hypothetical protein
MAQEPAWTILIRIVGKNKPHTYVVADPAGRPETAPPKVDRIAQQDEDGLIAVEPLGDR